MPGLSGGAGAGAGAVRAGRAYVELFLKDVVTGKALDRVKAKLQSIGSVLVKSGVAVGGIGAGIVAAFKPAIDALDDLGKIGNTAAAFGITGEKASRLFGIMAASGSDIRDATEGLVTFNQRVSDALAGTGEEAQKLFADLGRGPQEFAGGDTADRFYKLLDALRQVPDKAKQVELLGKALGEDTGKNLIPVLSMTAAQVHELGDAFQMSAADLREAREATRAQTLAGAMLSKVWREIGVAIAPVVKEIAERVVAVTKPVADFVRNNRELVATIFRVATGAVAVGTALVTLGTIVSGTGAAIGLLSSTFGAMVALWPFVKAGIVAIGSISAGPLVAIAAVTAGVGGLAYQFRDELGKAAKAGADQVRGLFEDVKRVGKTLQGSWEGVVDAVRAGDLKLAAGIALKTIELLWAQSTAAMTKKWIDFKRPLVDGWHQATGGLSDFFGTVEEIATRALDGLKRVGGVLGNLFSIEGLRNMEKALFDFIDGLIPGLGTRVGNAVQSIRDAVSGVVKALLPFVAPLAAPFAAAADLISEGWKGLSTNMAENIINAISWIDKALYRMSTKAENAFNAVARTVLDTTLTIAEALNKLPGLNFADEIQKLNELKGKVAKDVTDQTIADQEKLIDAKYQALIADVKAKLEVAKAERDAADATAKEDAENRVQEIEDERAKLIAQAKAEREMGLALAVIAAGFSVPRLQAGAQHAAAVATSAGSMGSFTAEAASQRFGGGGVQKKQLDRLSAIEVNTAAAAKAAEGFIKAMTLK